METSILFSGTYATGKTLLLRTLISRHNKSIVKEVSPEAFLSLSSDKFNSKFIYVLDEVVESSQLVAINKIVSDFGLTVYASTQLKSEIPEISKFSVFFLH